MPRLQIANKGEYLGLYGNIQRRGRLIGDQHRRFAGHRHGNHHPLAHPAGYLVRILLYSAFRVGNLYIPKQLLNIVTRAAGGGRRFMGSENFAELTADGHQRIQGSHGLLKNHPHAGTAQPAHIPLGKGEHIAIVQMHRAAGYLCRGLRQQAHKGQGGHRLARTALPNQAEGFALVKLKGKPIHHGYRPPGSSHLNGKVSCPQNRRAVFPVRRAIQKLPWEGRTKPPSSAYPQFQKCADRRIPSRACRHPPPRGRGRRRDDRSSPKPRPWHPP